MASFLSPVPFDAPEPVPWNWNPGATFLRSYYDAQENRRAQQEFEAGMEIERILLPSKIAKAEYEMKKFQLDSQLLEKIYRNQTAALDQSYSGINSALSGVRSGSSSGSGASSNVAGNGGSSNQAQSRYGGGVANMVQNYLQGGAVTRGGAGGGKILGQGHTGDDDY